MSFKIFNGRSSFFQWDLNQKLIVPESVKNAQIHFESPNEKNCYVLNAVNGVVNVPNILLQKHGKIVVWAYVSNGNDKHTVEKAAFAVNKRQKPSDYIYTETEILSLKALEERISRVEKYGGGGSGGGIGASGEDGGYYVPYVSDDGTLTWTASKDDMETVPLANIKGPAGNNGENGVGIASVTMHDSSVTGGANRLIIELTNGTRETFDIENPVGIEDLTVTESSASGGVNRLTIVLSNGESQRISVRNGKDGKDGQTGPAGSTGPAGESGFSPTVLVEQISGGNRLSITDVNGKKSFDVMNGAAGSAGQQGPKGDKGDAGAAGYSPVRGTDYWTAADIAEIKNYVDNAILTGAW